MPSLLPVLAIGAVVLFVGATLAVAGDTLGYDFLAYRLAAERVLHGAPLYDLSYSSAGGAGLFYYPPPFVLLVLPFALVPPAVATGAWLALMTAALIGGIAVMPVAARIRWLLLLLAGLSWPVAYALKLGQAGPIVFLAFAIGWRAIDRPLALGLSGALGTLVKLQPAVIVPWAVLTGRWRAAAVAIAALLVAAAAATAVVGVGAWFDYASLIRTISDPVTTPHNFTPGAIAFQAGLGAGTAALLETGVLVAVVVAMLASIRWSSAEASFLALVPASQLLSPVLWDHYALLLLIPVAYLLTRGFRWAAVIPLATATPLLTITPSVVYPVAFAVTLVATLFVGWASGPSSSRNQAS